MPIHQLIRDAIAADMEADPFFAGVRVYGLETFDPNLVDKPCVVVSYDAGTEQARGGTNARDDFAYPVNVGLHDVGVPNSGSRAGLDLVAFRDWVRAKYHMQPIPAVPIVMVCEFVGQPILDPGRPEFEHLVTAVQVVAVARVPRART